MRTIKFRGKRVDNGEWVYGDLIHDCNKNPMINIAGYSHTGAGFQYQIIVILETVGQFTGLFDKNGKEIYEGDNLLVNNSATAVVVWRNEGFDILDTCSCSPTSKGDIEGFVYARENKLQILGNIHDNPELKTDSE